MKLAREGLAHDYIKAQSCAGATWERTKYFVDTAVKVANLTARGLVALGDRVEPNVRQTGGGRCCKTEMLIIILKIVNNNVDVIQDAMRDVGFEL